MKWFAAILIVATVLLQYRLWLSDNGIREVSRLKVEVQAQRAANDEFAQRNRQLGAEVQRRALQLATLLEPLLIVAMGLVVMLIVLAVLLPIIQLNQLVR